MRYFYVLAVIACSTIGFAEEPRSIKVSAKSEIKVVPDEVVLALAVHARDESLLTAKRNNDKIANAVITLALNHGISATDVKVTDLDVSPDYGDYGRRQTKPVAYDFSRSIEVRLTDFDKIEPFLAEAFAFGLSHVARLQFRVSNQREHQFEARKLAVTYAKEKAEHLTELTGMKLGSPIRIEVDVEDNNDAGGFGGSIGAIRPQGRAGDIAIRKPGLQKLGFQKPGFTFVALQQAADDEADVLTAPGQIEITSEVTIEFEISK